jgi:carbon monoxide dehydrogenase subunit G
VIVENGFEVDAPLERVWPVLKDVPRVAGCIPNATITDVIDDRTYRADVAVKVGPVSVYYRATIVISEIDDGGHRAVLHVEARDKSGRGGVKATVTSTAAERDGRTHVGLRTDAQISGIVATVGGRLIEGVAKHTVAAFASNLSRDVLGASSIS